MCRPQANYVSNHPGYLICAASFDTLGLCPHCLKKVTGGVGGLPRKCHVINKDGCLFCKDDMFPWERVSTPAGSTGSHKKDTALQ